MSLPWPDLTTDEWNALIAKTKGETKHDLRGDVVLVIELDAVFDLVGTDESGNYGHEGRPGERGGSAPSKGVAGDGVRRRINVVGSPRSVEETRERLRAVPSKIVRETGVTEIHSSNNPAKLAKKIDDYLLRNYGFDMAGQASALVDRERRTIFTKPSETTKQLARLLEGRSQSKAWKKAIDDYVAKHPDPEPNDYDPISQPNPHEDSFVAVFAELFTGHVAREIMGYTNPITALLEHGPVKRLLHKWGWKI